MNPDNTASATVKYLLKHLSAYLWVISFFLTTVEALWALVQEVSSGNMTSSDIEQFLNYANLCSKVKVSWHLGTVCDAIWGYPRRRKKIRPRKAWRRMTHVLRDTKTCEQVKRTIKQIKTYESIWNDRDTRDEISIETSHMMCKSLDRRTVSRRCWSKGRGREESTYSWRCALTGAGSHLSW